MRHYACDPNGTVGMSKEEYGAYFRIAQAAGDQVVTEWLTRLMPSKQWEESFDLTFGELVDNLTRLGERDDAYRLLAAGIISEADFNILVAVMAHCYQTQDATRALREGRFADYVREWEAQDSPDRAF